MEQCEYQYDAELEEATGIKMEQCEYQYDAELEEATGIKMEQCEYQYDAELEEATEPIYHYVDMFTCGICGLNFQKRKSLIGHIFHHCDRKYSLRRKRIYQHHQYSESSRVWSTSKNGRYVNRTNGKYVDEDVYPCGNCGREFKKLEKLQDHVIGHNIGWSPNMYLRTRRSTPSDQRSTPAVRRSTPSDRRSTLADCNKQQNYNIYNTLPVITIRYPVRYCDCEGSVQVYTHIASDGSQCTRCTACNKPSNSKNMAMKCNLCHQYFRSEKHYKTHLLKHHKPCEVCHTRHHPHCPIRIHLQSYPVTCGICTRAFKNENQLRRHKETHVERPQTPRHKCDECSETFKYFYTLKTHKATHDKNNTKDVIIIV